MAPFALADLLERMVADHPDSPLVADIARVFGPQEAAAATGPSPGALAALCDHPKVAPFVKPRALLALKATLEAEAATEAPALHAALARRLLAEGLIDEDEVAQLLAKLAGEE